MRKAVIFGGRGFLGKEVSKKLEKEFQIFTSDRHSGGEKHYKADIKNKKEVKEAVKDKDIIINLVGLSPLKEPKTTSYHEVHVEGVKNILKSLNKRQKLIHISALGADKNSEIDYIKTKGKAEELIKNSNLKHTVFRPSVIFGRDSELIESISKTSWTIFFPKIPTKFQPIYRKDVAELISKAAKGEIKESVLDIAGKETLTFYELAKEIHKAKGLPIVPVPFTLFKAAFYVISRIGLFGITGNQYKSLLMDNTTKENKAKKHIKINSLGNWIKNSI